mmetsp:Transcript_10630/g.27573  ORF Transcript_10630/g.27573 Transcript_10630/m.27573 type:complete len:142 (+) Transcript_10630:159-584(+)
MSSFMQNMMKFFQELTGHGPSGTGSGDADGAGATDGTGGGAAGAAESFHEIFSSLLGAQQGHVSQGYFHQVMSSDEGTFCTETKMTPNKMAEYFTANSGDVALGKCSEDTQYGTADWKLQGSQSFRVQNKFFADFNDTASA